VQPAATPADTIVQHDAASAAAVEEPTPSETAPLPPPAVLTEAEQPTSAADGPAADATVMEDADESTAAAGEPAQPETAPLSPLAVSETAQQPTATTDGAASDDCVADSAEGDKLPPAMTKASQDQAARPSGTPPNSTTEPLVAAAASAAIAEVECECRMFSFGDFSPVDMSSIITTVGFPTERMVPVDRAATAQLPGNLTFGYAAPAEEASKDSGGPDGSQRGQGSLSLPPEHPTVSSPVPAQQADPSAGDSTPADPIKESRDHDTQLMASPVVSNDSKGTPQTESDSLSTPSVPSDTAAGSLTAVAEGATENKVLAAQPSGDGEAPAQPSAQTVHPVEEEKPAGVAALLASLNTPEPASTPKHTTASSAGGTAESPDGKASAPPAAATAPTGADAQLAADDTGRVKVRRFCTVWWP